MDEALKIETTTEEDWDLWTEVVRLPEGERPILLTVVLLLAALVGGFWLFASREEGAEVQDSGASGQTAPSSTHLVRTRTSSVESCSEGGILSRSC